MPTEGTAASISKPATPRRRNPPAARPPPPPFANPSRSVCRNCWCGEPDTRFRLSSPLPSTLPPLDPSSGWRPRVAPPCRSPCRHLRIAARYSRRTLMAPGPFGTAPSRRRTRHPSGRTPPWDTGSLRRHGQRPTRPQEPPARPREVLARPPGVFARPGERARLHGAAHAFAGIHLRGSLRHPRSATETDLR